MSLDILGSSSDHKRSLMIVHPAVPDVGNIYTELTAYG